MFYFLKSLYIRLKKLIIFSRYIIKIFTCFVFYFGDFYYVCNKLYIILNVKYSSFKEKENKVNKLRKITDFKINK